LKNRRIKDGKYGPAVFYAHWPDNEEEFNKVKSSIKLTGGTVKLLKAVE